MSQAEIERFIADLKTTPSLKDELPNEAPDVASIIKFAESKGYQVTLNDADIYVSAQANLDLSEEQLDMISGGSSEDPPTSVNGAVID